MGVTAPFMRDFSLRFLKHHAHVVQAGDEAAAINLAATRCSVVEPDDAGAVLTKASGESESLRVVGERAESGFAVAIIAHEDCEFTAWGQDTGTICDERGVAFKECFQRRRARQVSWVVGVKLLPPLGRMRPDEIECRAGRQIVEAVCVGRVKALADVPRQAGNAKFSAYVRACAASGHGIEDSLRVEKQEQVTNEPAATISRIFAVAVFTGAVEVIKAGQMRHWTGVAGRKWKPGINRRVLATRRRLVDGSRHAGRIERID